jgi:ketosteroid isomerase-like protein
VPKENLELVKAIYARRENMVDVSPAELEESFRDQMAEDFEIRLPPQYPEGGQVFVGRDGATRFVAAFREAWTEWRIEPVRYFDGGGRVVVFVRIHAAGEASGLELEHEPAHLWTIRDGRAASLEIFLDRGDALEAAGLDPRAA